MKVRELAELLLQLPLEQQEMEVATTEEGEVIPIDEPRVAYKGHNDFLTFKENDKPFIYI